VVPHGNVLLRLHNPKSVPGGTASIAHHRLQTFPPVGGSVMPLVIGQAGRHGVMERRELLPQ